MKKSLSLETLPELAGGKVRVAANAALNTMLADIEDRGDDMKSRKVVITIEAGKIAHESPDIYIDVAIKTTIPSYATGSTVARLTLDSSQVPFGGRSKWAAQFEPESPDRPDQPTMFDRPRHPEAPDEELGGE